MSCSEYHNRLRGHVVRPLHQWSEALGVVEVRTAHAGRGGGDACTHGMVGFVSKAVSLRGEDGGELGGWVGEGSALPQGL